MRIQERGACSVTLALVLIVGLTAANSLLGALPPSAYLSDQAAAPEALVIEVLSVQCEVKEDAEGTVTSVRAHARVLEVKRTASDLTRGDEIDIAYTNVELKRDATLVGPSHYIPVLQKGSEVPAFVAGNKKSGYQPAARIYSFQRI